MVSIYSMYTRYSSETASDTCRTIAQIAKRRTLETPLPLPLPPKPKPNRGGARDEAPDEEEEEEDGSSPPASSSFQGGGRRIKRKREEGRRERYSFPGSVQRHKYIRI